jgi:hypothetical protein
MELNKKTFKKWLSNPRNDHVVAYYSSDKSLVKSLYGYVHNSIESGESSIVITKPSILELLRQEITKHKLDTKTFSMDQLTVFNSTDLLEDFMVDSLPNKELFFAKLKGIISEQATKTDKPLRIYGDMVATLWEEGKKNAAMELEKLWNELADIYSFSLYCAYPTYLFTQQLQESDSISAYHDFSTNLTVA